MIKGDQTIKRGGYSYMRFSSIFFLIILLQLSCTSKKDLDNQETQDIYKKMELYLDELITSVGFLANNVNLESLELVAGSYLPDYFTKTVLLLDVAPLANLKKLKYLAIRGFWPGNEQEVVKLLGALPELETIN
jgi:hypothetical protein